MSSIDTDKNEVLPSIGMRGIYTLAEPFNTMINANTEYVCTAVETIASLVSKNIDVKQTIYLDNALDITIYDAAAQANQCIITLQSDSGTQIEFPSAYLLSFPNSNVVRYSTLVAMISLSAIADSVNLNPLLSEISELVLARIGVRNETVLANVGVSYLVSKEKHDLIQAARQGLIQSSGSVFVQLEQAQATIAEQTQKIATLSDYIANRLPAP